jgi:hypothetical protein
MQGRMMKAHQMGDHEVIYEIEEEHFLCDVTVANYRIQRSYKW